MEMPAEYMFKGVPHYEDDEVEDPVQVVLAEHGRATASRSSSSASTRTSTRKRAVREHPDRFAGMLNVDPNTGMEAVRSIDAAIEEWGDSLRAVHCWGTGLIPQVPLDDKRMYPDLRQVRGGRAADHRVRRRARAPHPDDGPAPDAARRGVLVLPRAPDRVAPRRRAVDRADGEAAPQVARACTTRRARSRRSTTREDIIEFANSRGADKVIYAGYYAAGAVPRPHLRRAARRSASATTCGRSSSARTRSGSSASELSRRGGPGRSGRGGPAPRPVRGATRPSGRAGHADRDDRHRVDALGELDDPPDIVRRVGGERGQGGAVAEGTGREQQVLHRREDRRGRARRAGSGSCRRPPPRRPVRRRSRPRSPRSTSARSEGSSRPADASCPP